MYLPHPLDRPHQLETYQKIINSKKQFVIIQSPTGSGKSAWAAQAASDGHRVITLTKTKSLQQQYVNGYGFIELFGKSNYECLQFGQQYDLFSQEKIDTETTADLCVVPDSFKRVCKNSCPYPLARQDFLNSNAGSLNYSKFLLDRLVVEQFNPDILFLDEAHELSDLVVEFSGITLKWNSKRLQKYAQPIIIDLPQPLAINAGQEYLRDLRLRLNDRTPKHPSEGGDKREFKYWERLNEQIDITTAAMTINPECWYIYANNKHFVAKPLTARFHFNRLFSRAPKIVLMSATIGKIPYFIRELGIDNFEFINVPNVWPAPLRPIEALQAPRMGFKSTKEEWDQHSKIIAQRLSQCPTEWTGIIHSPSKWLTWDLAERLHKLTRRNIFVPDEKWGTEEAAEKWLAIENDGTICVSWHFWEGIDAGKDNFCCVAKIPFVDFSDEFDKNRFFFDGKSGYQRVANKMVQGLGRVRRGYPEHYGNNKVVCVADGNWTRLRNYISKDVLEAIR